MLFSRPPSMPADVREAIEAYEARICELLTSCADHQRHDPEVFLWNARRSLEAICHLLLTVHRRKVSLVAKATPDSSLEGMIRKLRSEAVLDREQGPRFELARSHTNLGVHIQQPEREDYAAAIGDTAHVLTGILDWLYDESPAAPYLSLRGRLPIETIRAGGREGPSLKDAATVAQAEKRVVELTATGLRSELAQAQRELKTRETRTFRWLWRVFVASSGAFATGACIGVTLDGLWPPGGSTAEAASGSVSIQPSAQVAEAVRPSTSVPVASSIVASPAVPAPPHADDAAVAAASSTPTAPLEAEPPACPDGMVPVPGVQQLHLGQPVGGRANWPKAQDSPVPQDVEPFCMDALPRARAAVSRESYDRAGVARCERGQPRSDRPTERTCLTRDEAEAFCEAAAVGGHLPGILEWEAAARGSLEDLVLPEHEWVGERFPPLVLRRSDPSWSRGDGMWVGRIPPKREPTTTEGTLLLAWNQQDPSARNAERGFRCAAPLP